VDIDPPLSELPSSFGAVEPVTHAQAKTSVSEEAMN
jgi:hypothetical protein